ncbi:MAG: SHOCT domain-containing protein [Chloroflexi bacterium]|nr:SHOCT domain-containing protein [Chloroflexota bacterium]
MMGFGFGFGGILMVIFWVAIIGLAVWLLSWLFPRAIHNVSSNGTLQRADVPDSPTEILKQRYARGEITKDQFEQMRRDVEA